MTNDKVNQVLRGIVAQLENYNAKSADEEGECLVLRPVAQLNHCKALAILAIEIPTKRLEKKLRWLGFIQGVLWAHGLSTLEDLKKANMPTEEKTDD
jgi:hypothetical protein